MWGGKDWRLNCVEREGLETEMCGEGRIGD